MEKQFGWAPVEIATGEILIAHASRYEQSAIGALNRTGLDRDKFEVRPIAFHVNEE